MVVLDNILLSGHMCMFPWKEEKYKQRLEFIYSGRNFIFTNTHPFNLLYVLHQKIYLLSIFCNGTNNSYFNDDLDRRAILHSNK